MTVIFSKDTLRASVEAATGGKVTVMYDDKGYPSYMVRIPKFNVEDVNPLLGEGVHPAFIVDGVEKSEIFIGQYLAKVRDGRAFSLPGVDPANMYEYQDAQASCCAKGPGWHLMTNWEWAAVMHWCLANGFQPRGNTNYGRHHELKHETGTRFDGKAPGMDGSAVRTLTGSGPCTWRHDNSPAGICDLVGNAWEWLGGLRLSEGRIFMPEDNNYALPEADFPATDVYLDGTATGETGDVGDIQLAVGISNATTAEEYLQNKWTSTGKTTGYNALPTFKKQRMMQAAVDPSFTTEASEGLALVRNHGERRLRRGGGWADGINAGLGAFNIAGFAWGEAPYIGFRPAFIL